LIARIEGDKGGLQIIAAYRVLKDGRIVEIYGAFLFDIRPEVLFSAVCGGCFWGFGQCGILFFKNFGAGEVSWQRFFTACAYGTGMATLLLRVLAQVYFCRKGPSLSTQPSVLEPALS
jgi:hypothetical protein